MGFPCGSHGKESDCQCRRQKVPESGRSSEEVMATHFSIPAWRIPWTEEHGKLLSTGSQRIGHGRSYLSTHAGTLLQMDLNKLITEISYLILHREGPGAGAVSHPSHFPTQHLVNCQEFFKDSERLNKKLLEGRLAVQCWYWWWWNSRWAISNPKRWCCESAALNMPAIWNTQQWPEDWKRSVFTPIPKKGNAKKCSNYHTIALI